MRILVGMKSDLRKDKQTFLKLVSKKQVPITTQEVRFKWKLLNKWKGEELAKKMGFAAYCETSALTGEGVLDCFKVAITLSLLAQEKQFTVTKPKKSAFEWLNIKFF